MPGHCAEAFAAGGDKNGCRERSRDPRGQRGTRALEQEHRLTFSHGCSRSLLHKSQRRGSRGCQAPPPLSQPRRVWGVQPWLSAHSWDGAPQPEIELSLLTSPLGAFMPRPSNSCYSEGTGRTGQLSFCKDIQVLQKKKKILKNISYCSRTSALSPKICCFH